MSKHNSILLRLCLVIMLLATGVFVFISGRSYSLVKEKTQKDVDEKVQLVLGEATEIVYRHLSNVEVAGYSLASQALHANLVDINGEQILQFSMNQENIESDSAIYNILEKFLEANPHLWGAAIGFEPNVFPKYGEKGFAPFVRHSDSVFSKFNLTEERKDFRTADWYKETKKQNKPRWSAPFVDVRGTRISCFCIPIHNQNNEFIGTIAVDLQLEQFATILCNEIQPYEHSEVLLYEVQNDFLIYKQNKAIKNETIASLEELKTRISDDKTLIYDMPVKSSNWVVVLKCTEDDIYEDVQLLTYRVTKMIILGILLMLVCCGFIFYQMRKVVEQQAGIDSELNIATKIQIGMLSKNFPEKDIIDIHAIMTPAKEVGGDFYDFEILDNKLYFAIGDVSGKGIPASIVMAITKSLVHMYNGMNLPMEQLVAKLNNSIAHGNEVGMFVTFFVGRIDLQTLEFEYCNAGHNPLVIVTPNSEAQFLDVQSNIAIGVFEDFVYKGQKMTLEKGTCLALYTDGVTEAEKATHEQFGEARLLDWANSETLGKSIDATTACNDLQKEIINFVDGNEQNDDITIMTIRL